MLTVHHLNNSRSQRLLWLLEELGLAYEIVRYQRQPDMRAPAELRAVHPLGKSPVITDNGNTIAESGAITEYILDTYGEGRLMPPPKTPERLRYTYWLHYAEGSAMPPLLLKLLFTLMPKRAPALLRPLVRKVSNQALTTLVNPWRFSNAFTPVRHTTAPSRGADRIRWDDSGSSLVVIASEARQSRTRQRKTGLLRRFAPRNDDSKVAPL